MPMQLYKYNDSFFYLPFHLPRHNILFFQSEYSFVPLFVTNKPQAATFSVGSSRQTGSWLRSHRHNNIKISRQLANKVARVDAKKRRGGGWSTQMWSVKFNRWPGADSIALAEEDGWRKASFQPRRPASVASPHQFPFSASSKMHHIKETCRQTQQRSLCNAIPFLSKFAS